MTHLEISWTINAVGLKLCKLSHQLLSKKIGKLISTFLLTSYVWLACHSFIALCCLFSAGLIKLLTGRRCTSEIGQKRLKELKYNSENFKVVADIGSRKAKLGVLLQGYTKDLKPFDTFDTRGVYLKHQIKYDADIWLIKHTRTSTAFKL